VRSPHTRFHRAEGMFDRLTPVMEMLVELQLEPELEFADYGEDD